MSRSLTITVWVGQVSRLIYLILEQLEYAIINRIPRAKKDSKTSRERVTERYACVPSTATNTMRSMVRGEGTEEPLAQEHRDKPGVMHPNNLRYENKGGDVKRAGA
jgi:hypothetical protein